MDIDTKNHTGNLDLPYKYSISKMLMLAAFCCALGGWTLYTGLYRCDPDVTNVFNNIRLLSLNDIGGLFCSTVLLVFGVCALGRTLAVWNAGSAYGLRVTPDSIVVPKGYFKIRSVPIYATDIKEVRTIQGGKFLLVRYKDGKSYISRELLCNQAFDMVLQRLQSFTTPIEKSK